MTDILKNKSVDVIYVGLLEPKLSSAALDRLSLLLSFNQTLLLNI